MSKIIITGATGHLGNATIEFLLNKGVEANNISTLVRDVEKAEALKNKGVNLKIGDYDNYASLVNAFKGADKLLLVSASEINKRLTQHENVINAAKEAGVKHVVYTSIERKDETEDSPLWLVTEAHLRTEKWLKESGLTYTILKNNLYMDYIPVFIGDKVLETSTIYLPAGNGKVSAALRSEYAEAIANILTSQGHENKAYDFTNIEAYSYNDVAKHISEITGKTIQYVSPSADEFTQALTSAGVPAEGIGVLSGFAVAQGQGDLEFISTDLENLLGRKPTALKPYLETIYSSKNKIMTSQKSFSKVWNIALWVAQVLLASMFIMVGLLKTFSPISELVAQGMDYGVVMTRFIGITELLGAVGLILPALLRIKPVLTIWAAVGIAVTMVLAVGYHILQNDFAHLGMPALLGIVAVFIIWGRSKKAPVLAKV